MFEIMNFESLKNRKFDILKMCSRLGFHFGARQKRKVATKIISCKRYREILFQKVASDYLLYFVQNGSSTNILTNMFCTKVRKIRQLQQIPYIFPLTPDQPPFKGGRHLNKQGPRGSPRAHRSEGFPRTGLFHPWARWDLAHFQSCSRSGACAFLQIP